MTVPRRLFFAILTFSSAGFTGCARTASDEAAGVAELPAVEIDAVAVRSGPISAVLDTFGTLLPVRAATIVAEIDGVIQTLPDSPRIIRYEEDGVPKSEALGLDIGIAVEEGEVLVQLDPTDFQLAVERAEAQRALANSRLADLKAWRRHEEKSRLAARLAETEAASRLAEADFQRLDRLRGGGAISAGEYDTALAARDRAQAQLEQSRAELQIGQEGPTVEQLAVAEAELQVAEVEVRRSRHQLEKTTIRAPYPAVITDRFLGVGDRVTAMPRMEIMQIVDARLLLAEVDVPERYQGQIRADDPAEIRVAGRAEPIPGRVELIDGRIDPETRTFRARIAVDNRTLGLRPGGFLHARLQIASRDNALLVPRDCLSFADGQPAVYVVQGSDIVAYRPVELGIGNDAICEVLGGLAAGEVVALANPALLTDGLRVRVREQDLPLDALTRQGSAAAAPRVVASRLTQAGDAARDELQGGPSPAALPAAAAAEVSR